MMERDILASVQSWRPCYDGGIVYMVTAMFSEIRQLHSERWDRLGYSLETCALSVDFIFEL